MYDFGWKKLSRVFLVFPLLTSLVFLLTLGQPIARSEGNAGKLQPMLP